MEIAANPGTAPRAADLTSCAGCGACCSIQGAPPDYVALSVNPAFARDPSFSEDADRLAQLPDTARAELERYLAGSAAGEMPTDGPCVWYDPVLTRCKHYEWRPSSCRVFELDGPGCHIYRRLQGLEGGKTPA